MIEIVIKYRIQYTIAEMFSIWIPENVKMGLVIIPDKEPLTANIKSIRINWLLEEIFQCFFNLSINPKLIYLLE